MLSNILSISVSEKNHFPRALAIIHMLQWQVSGAILNTLDHYNYQVVQYTEMLI